MPAFVSTPDSSAETGAGGDRVRLRQPDVQREHARLGTEAEQHAQRRCPQRTAVFDGRARRAQLGDHERPRQVVKQQKPHQRHESAEHGDGQIRLSGGESALRLLLHDPDVGAETHQLEEEERRVEVGGEKHARREAETEQEEEVVPPQVVVMAEILRREECRDKPHEADDRAVELAEAVEAEREVHDRDGDDPVAAEPNRRQHEREHHARDGDGRRAECALAAQTGDGDADRREGGQKYEGERQKLHHSVTALPITSSSHCGNRPSSSPAAARITIGTVICQPASRTESAAGGMAVRRGKYALMTT